MEEASVAAKTARRNHSFDRPETLDEDFRIMAMRRDWDATRKATKTWTTRLVIGAIVFALAGAAAWVWTTLHFSYSSGERAGFVQKISERGWLCKTFEGDLAMVNLPGQPAETFSFTVRDRNVFKELNVLAGRKVILQYTQHKGVPSTCFGDTEYFVTGVRVLDTP